MFVVCAMRASVRLMCGGGTYAGVLCMSFMCVREGGVVCVDGGRVELCVLYVSICLCVSY